jgi:hypothetical protein
MDDRQSNPAFSRSEKPRGRSLRGCESIVVRQFYCCDPFSWTLKIFLAISLNLNAIYTEPVALAS